MTIQHTYGVLSDNQDWFYYSSYWRTWNRILVRGGRSHGFITEVAVDLTPINNDWNDVLKRRIRVYTPQQDSKDIYTHILPQEVYEGMRIHLEFKDLVWLLDVDIMRNVNMQKLAKADGNSDSYDKLMCDGEGDRNWLNKYKSFPQFFERPQEQSQERLKEKLLSLSEKYKPPFPGNPFNKVKG